MSGAKGGGSEHKNCLSLTVDDFVLIEKRRWHASPMRSFYQTSSTVETSVFRFVVFRLECNPPFLPCFCPKLLPNIPKLPKNGVSTSKSSVSFSFSALLKLSLAHAPVYLAGKKLVETCSNAHQDFLENGLSPVFLP